MGPWGNRGVPMGSQGGFPYHPRGGPLGSHVGTHWPLGPICPWDPLDLGWTLGDSGPWGPLALGDPLALWGPGPLGPGRMGDDCNKLPSRGLQLVLGWSCTTLSYLAQLPRRGLGSCCHAVEAGAAACTCHQRQRRPEEHRASVISGIQLCKRILKSVL